MPQAPSASPEPSHAAPIVRWGGTPRRASPPGLVEPHLDELAQRLGAVPGAGLLRSGLADPGGADHRQVVAVPLVGHPDPAAAHADDVVDVAVVALHANRGEDEAPLLVH